MTTRAVVLIPAYNAEATLCDAVLSLFPAKTAFDVLIVDDGSQVPVESVIATNAALAPYRGQIHVLRHHPNRGLIPTLNEGVNWALERKYPYIIRMDSDDLARPGRIDRQIEFMDAHPDVAVSGTQIKRFMHELEDFGDSNFPLAHDDIRHHMHLSASFSHPTMIIRSETFHEVGLYDPRYLHAEDYEWAWRCVRKVKMANLPDFLLNYRISPNQISAKNRKRQLLNKSRILLREIGLGEISCMKGLAAVAAVFFLPLHVKISLQRLAEHWTVSAGQ